jgi:hypothetical protein
MGKNLSQNHSRVASTPFYSLDGKYRLRDWESEVIIFDSLSHLKQVLGNGLTPAIAIVSVLCKIFHSEIIYHYLNVCAVENITLSSPRASRYIRRKSHILYPYLFCNF